MDTNFARKIYIIGFVILVSVLFIYQILMGEYYLKRAKENYVRVSPIYSMRGTIYDRNGQPLAYDKASFNLAVIPYQIKNRKEQLFEDLASYLNFDVRWIRRNYNRDLVNYFSPIDIVNDVDKEKAFEAEEKFSDVMIDPQPRRYYPYGPACAHVLGYVRKDKPLDDNFKKYGYGVSGFSGVSGVEEYYDSYLKGQDGGNSLEINAKGQVVGFLGEEQAQKGQDVYLTIDAHLQQAAYESMGEKKGAFILMDSNSGEVLVLVSSPSFDPNMFIRGKNTREILFDEAHPLLNRAIGASYQPGSTFKPIVALGALTEHKIVPSTTFICTGRLTLGKAVFKCMHVHGPQDLYQGLIHSCNVYFYNVGLTAGEEIVIYWAQKLALDLLTGIDLPYEIKGKISSPAIKLRIFNEQWYPGDTCNLSIGQGFTLVTPIANLVAMNVFATNGYIVRPHLLKKIGDIASGTNKRYYAGTDPKSLAIVKTALIDVVDEEGGTGNILKSLNFNIAGKTGTAQASGGPSHGWFVGFFPYEAPKYTVCVFLEHGGSSFESLKVLYDFLKKVKEQKLLAI